MATIVWENEFERYAANIQSAVTYLIANTYIGSFYYPTLPTILSFRAIIGYLQRIKPIQGQVEFVLIGTPGPSDQNSVQVYNSNDTRKEVIRYTVDD